MNIFYNDTYSGVIGSCCFAIHIIVAVMNHLRQCNRQVRYEMAFAKVYDVSPHVLKQNEHPMVAVGKVDFGALDRVGCDSRLDGNRDVEGVDDEVIPHA